MCDIRAYLKKETGDELLLESVVIARPIGGEVVLKSLFGEEITVSGRISLVEFSKNRITIES